MKYPNIRWIIPTAVILPLLIALACGAGSEPAPTPTDPPTAAPSTLETAQPSTPEPTQPSAPTVGTRVGDRAPDFTLTLSQDQQISSTELVAQGKPIFILFHATW